MFFFVVVGINFLNKKYILNLSWKFHSLSYVDMVVCCCVCLSNGGSNFDSLPCVVFGYMVVFLSYGGCIFLIIKRCIGMINY